MPGSVQFQGFSAAACESRRPLPFGGFSRRPPLTIRVLIWPQVQCCEAINIVIATAAAACYLSGMDDFIEAMKAKIEALETELSGDSRYRQLVRLRDTLKEFEQASAPKSAVPPGFKLVLMTKEEKVYEGAKGFLKVHEVALVRKIAKYLVDQGVLPEGDEGVRQLRIYLSKWRDEFVTEGRGWVRLAEKGSHHPEKQEKEEGHEEEEAPE